MEDRKIVFVGRVSKDGNKHYIRVPKKLLMMVEHGKRYRVTLEPLEEG